MIDYYNYMKLMNGPVQVGGRDRDMMTWLLVVSVEMRRTTRAQTNQTCANVMMTKGQVRTDVSTTVVRMQVMRNKVGTELSE